ncbi:alpha amylase C-terminal domain-containing protein [Bradyrhizobium sp. CCGE-LA001]|uniref:alpha amylase C-terminal domain-containing protein n=1 Tax=Bradyrhizobium sp. CCGE-LA001 TaxID=1223566 RepID=UPI000745E98F|nr:alpha amylase C-terminal domain-containing protein [Bradyrhizobium sp. CCGE-LA001]AMA60155.1 1,4-alpha-glucan branching protein [Bradyrhizobium sp. CCGE-LA001]
MPVSQGHVTGDIPMGSTLVDGGCVFRLWAPRASEVHVLGDFNRWQRTDASLLVKNAAGHWTGFFPGAQEGEQYKYWVSGPGSVGFKRDPFARELEGTAWNCVIRDPKIYPWHDAEFKAPAFEDLIIYQFHIGSYYAVDNSGKDARRNRGACFLDLLDRVEYLVELGVTAVQPLPIVEFPTRFSQGYNGTDYFSPEFSYSVDDGELDRYLARANRLLSLRGKSPLRREHLRGGANQLRALIDVLHVYDIAVLFDVVYNHAGGDFGDESLFFIDRLAYGNHNDSLYFTDRDWAGGLVFAYWNDGVRQFLIDNARFFLDEFHVDGFRYDEVSVIDRFGGWHFCQALTETIRFAAPSAAQIAEFWNPRKEFAIKPPSAGGGGFDLVWDDRTRDAVRGALAQAAAGRDAPFSWSGVASALGSAPGLDYPWRAVAMLENHDLLLASHSDADKKPRIPVVADPSNPRSWYARSRARVAAGLLMMGPGVPLLFMGQEFLEDKYWDDSIGAANLLIWWDGLSTDRAMSDYLRFMRELIALRRKLDAVRRGRINVYHAWDTTRVLAYHRWIEGSGQDVVIIASLSEVTYYGYRLGFPRPGRWIECFNSDVYDNWINPITAGNGGAIIAYESGIHGLPAYADVVIPANAILTFSFAP